MRRLLAAIALPLVLLPPLPARAAVPVVFVDGRGFGHGVGMAQDGALAMGKAGATTPAILGQFYPGAAIGKASGGVRVAVHTAAGNEVVLGFPHGGEVRDAPAGPQSAGFPVAVRPGGQVRIRVAGGTYSVEVLGGSAAGSSQPASATSSPPATSDSSGGALASSSSEESTTTTVAPSPTLVPPPATSSTTAPPPPTTASTAPTPPPGSKPPPPGDERTTSNRPLWAFAASGGVVAVPARGRQYRGGIEATAAGGPLRLVNQLDVEVYLKGMGEVRDPRWPPAALRAQAIAARTYALRATAAGAELCDDQRCQVYLGAQAEYAAMNKAVADSAGQVLTFGRKLASAVYSANGGGHSATTEEGFGTPGDGYPYLRAATYQTTDPLPWSVTIALSDVASRLRYPGQVTDVRVGRAGPSGRAIEVILDGTAGPKAVTGLAFDAALGLRSTLFTLRVGTSDAPPPPPGEASDAQVLPDEVAVATAPAPAAAVPDLPPGPRGAGRPAASGVSGGPLVALATALVAAVGTVSTRLVHRHHRHRWAHLRRHRWLGWARRGR